MKSFYERTLSNIAKLPLNLSDLTLPSFIWRLNECEMSKFGTYLLAIWKQSSLGKVTTNISENNELFEVNQFRTDIEQRRFLREQKWFIYRMRYWEKEEKEDIVDFQNETDDGDNNEEKEGVEWFGSNDRGEGHILIEDRICIQNDHCYGKPSLFLWSHDFCNDSGGQNVAKPIKIRTVGV